MPQKAHAALMPEIDDTTDVGAEFVSSSLLYLTINGNSYPLSDSDPFDTTYEYVYQTSDCGGDEAKIGWYEAAANFEAEGAIGTTNTLHYKYQGTNSNGTQACLDGEADITFGAAHPARHWDAYFIDDNNIFAPTWIFQECVEWTGDELSARQNGLFRRWPEDEIGYNPANYIRITEGGSYVLEPNQGGPNTDADNQWVTLSMDSAQAPLSSVTTGAVLAKAECSGSPDQSSMRTLDFAPYGTPLPRSIRMILENDYGFAFGENGEVTVPTTTVDDTDESCSGNSGILGWMLCPAAELLDGILGFLDDQIEKKLVITGDYYDNPGLKAAWTTVRNISYALLVPVMLVMVIGTALGFEVFSAYTIKKALPRMVIAVIFISLSWYICVLLIEFFNVVGGGIRGLITAPFNIPDGGALKVALANANLGDSGHGFWGTIATQGAAFAGLGVAAAAGTIALAYVGIGVLLSTLLSAALVLGLALMILLARQMFIVAAIILAPLAILAWIFPGNDKLWKLWWNMFTKLLMIFPLIMLLIALGQVFGNLIGDVDREGDSIIRVITVIGAVIIPYAAIPFTFKWAGGVFGNLAGMVNDRNKGMLDRLKKGRHETGAKRWNEFKTGTGNGAFRSSGFAKGLGTRVGAGAGGGKGVFGYGQKGKARLDQMSRENAMSQIMKSPAWNGVNQDDNALHAGILMEDMSKKDAIKHMVNEYGIKEDEAERATAAWQASGLSGRAAAVAAAQQLVSTGTGFKRKAGHTSGSDLEFMARTLARASGGNASTATALSGFANSEAKKTGTHHLAPGFSTVASLTSSFAGSPSGALTTGQSDALRAAHTEAWNSGSLYEHANDKPENLKAHISHFESELTSADPASREKAATFFAELEAMQPNAKGVNGDLINEALTKNKVMRDSVVNALPLTTAAGFEREDVVINPATGKPVINPATGKPQTVSRLETADERIRRQARTYERIDPNRIT